MERRIAEDEFKKKYEKYKYIYRSMGTFNCFPEKKPNWRVKTYDEWLKLEKKYVLKLKSMDDFTRHLLLSNGMDVLLFNKIYIIERNLQKLMLENVYFSGIQVRNYLRLLNKKMSLVFQSAQKPLIPRWIKLTAAHKIAMLSDYILILSYESYIILHDQLSGQRYLYNTVMNGDSGPKIIAAPAENLKTLMFAYAEAGDVPNIYVIGFPSLKKIGVLKEQVRGDYVHLNFSSKSTVLSLKNLGHADISFHFCLWNGLTGEKLATYKPEYIGRLRCNEPAIACWHESSEFGAILQSCFKLNQAILKAQPLLQCTIIREHCWERKFTFFKTTYTFDRSLVPADACISRKGSLYVVDEEGDLYQLCYRDKPKMCLAKKWVRNKLYEFNLKVKVCNYKSGLLMYGPDGYIKMYEKKDGAFHCSWSIEVYSKGVEQFIVGADKCYVICPKIGVLVLQNKEFATVFPFEDIRVRDLILVQPRCKYLLMVDTRRNVTAFDVKTGFELKKLFFPKKFRDFPYIVNPSYPYILFVSNKIGQVFVFDVDSIWNPYIVNCIDIGLEKITCATFSNDGLFLAVSTAAKTHNIHIIMIVKYDFFSYNFLDLHNFTSKTPVTLCTYSNLKDQLHLLALKKCNPLEKTGNEVMIWRQPNQFLGTFKLDVAYQMLYSMPNISNILFGKTDEVKVKWMRFDLKIVSDPITRLYSIEQINTTLFLPNNIGNIEVLFTNSNVLIYGLHDSQMIIYDPKISLERPIFKYHVNFCSKKGPQLVSEDFRRVVTDETCTKIITYGLDNVIVKHRFSLTDQYRREPGDLYFGTIRTPSWKRKIFCDCFNWDFYSEYDVGSDSVGYSSENLPEDDSCKEEVVLKGASWKRCTKTLYAVIFAKKPLSSSDTETSLGSSEALMDDISSQSIFFLKKFIRHEMKTVSVKMSKLVRACITSGQIKIDATLLILDNMELSTFLISIEYMNLLLDSEMQMRIRSLVYELKHWIALFRKPYNTPKAVKGLTNAVLTVWSIGTRNLGEYTVWKRNAFKLWYSKTHLSCFYSIKTLLPGLRPETGTPKEVMSLNTILSNSFETIHVRRTGRRKKRPVKHKVVSKMITDAVYSQDLSTAIIRYMPEKIYGRKLGTFGLKDNTFALRNEFCENGKDIGVYRDCSHKPKCWPRPYKIRCPLFMHKFPETTEMLRSLNVPPTVLRHKFHHNVKQYALSTDSQYALKVPQCKALNITSQVGASNYMNAPPHTFVNAQKNAKLPKEKTFWDPYSMLLCATCKDYCDRGMKSLLKEIYFGCPSRSISKNRRRSELLKLYKDFWHNVPTYPLSITMLMPWLKQVLLGLKQIEKRNTIEHKKLLNKFPQILSERQVFLIPDWLQQFMDLIVEPRLDLCGNLAKLYLAHNRTLIFGSKVDLDHTYESETISTDSAGDNCDYDRPPFFKISDFKTYRFPNSKVRNLRSTAKKHVNIKGKNRSLRKKVINMANKNPLRNTTLDEPLNFKNQTSVNLINEPLITEGSIKNKYQLEGALEGQDRKENSAQTNLPKQITYSRVSRENVKLYPYNLVPPSKPGGRWKPLTLKMLIKANKPYSERYLPLINELFQTTPPKEVLHWIKSFVQNIHKIQKKFEEIFVDFNLDRLHKEHYKGYLNLIKPTECLDCTKFNTLELIALLADRITRIKNYVTKYALKILQLFWKVDIWKNNPLKYERPVREQIAKFSIKIPSPIAIIPRFGRENVIYKLLKSRDYIRYKNKFFKPKGFLRKLAFDRERRTRYLLQKFMLDKLIQVIRKEFAQIPGSEAKEWFKFKPLKSDAPNWELIILTAVASQIFCNTMNNIADALYKFLDQNKVPVKGNFKKKDKFLPYQVRHEKHLKRRLCGFKGKPVPTPVIKEVKRFKALRDSILTNHYFFIISIELQL